MLETETEAIEQPELEFFHFPEEAPTPEDRLKFLDPINPESPWYNFVGNRKAVNKAIRLEFNALGKYNHDCSDLSIAVIGRSGCGKTDFVKRHALANGLPTAFIYPRSINSTHDIFTAAAQACLDRNCPLVEIDELNHYKFPPINIFIDEVHALHPNIVQGLLNATEHEDAILNTEKGIVVDCSNVHWIIATTDRGKLFDAFDVRFNKIELSLYSRKEISQIIQNKYSDWTKEACDLVAHYCSRIPREALAFAREMQLEKEMHPDNSWEDVAKIIAEDNNIDPFGITYTRLKILKQLAFGPIASKRLPIIAGVKEEELNKFILPWLLEPTEEDEPLITVSQRGYVLTEAGIAELGKRNIIVPEVS